MENEKKSGPDKPIKGGTYADWIDNFDRPKPKDIEVIRAAISAMDVPPLISIIMTGNGTTIGTGPQRTATTGSVLGQIYHNWELLVPLGVAADQESSDPRIRVLASGSFNAAVAQARGEYLTFVGAGDTLPPHALFTLLSVTGNHPVLIYSDEDECDAAGLRQHPQFKPDWNPDLFLGQDYACRLALLSTAAASGLGRGRPSRRAVYDLILQVILRQPRLAIRHIPKILYHRHADEKMAEAEWTLVRRSLEEHVQALPRREGLPAPTVSPIGAGLHRITWPLPVQPPRVSCIVPTRDRVELLRTCIDGLRLATDYPDMEIVIVDNGSVEPETFDYFRSLGSDKRVRIMPYSGNFNYSAINNFGCSQATGGILALLNNDIKVHEPGWLREMVSHALRPGVGAVGALLWYNDDTVQHAGVTLGIGGSPSHIFKRHKQDSPGYCSRLKLTQDMSAVTAACLVIKRTVWDHVGGLDEGFAVAYGDVDLCLRLRDKGYRIIWTPFARLYHQESASRGYENTPEKLAHFTIEKAKLNKRWAKLIKHDPYYNPNLSLTSTDCQLAFPPRLPLPWGQMETKQHKRTLHR